MGCLIAIVVILLLVWLVESPSTFLIGLFAFIGVMIWVSISEKKRKEEESRRKIIEDEKNNDMFKEKKIRYNIKENHLTVNYKRGFASIEKKKHYIWIEEEKLCFFPTTAQSDARYCPVVHRVPLKDIEYYATQGNISKETKISGGGGEIGGSSIGGAIVGGVIAGGAGAVIGSRKKGKIEPIKSEIITHDNRETFLNYFVDGVKHAMFFDYEDYATLLKIMPNKEYNNFANTHVSTGSNQSIKEQLMDLSDLKNQGILTEQEFDEKKKILLDKIK